MKVTLNRINPAKLLNSKWTARQPQNKEKHFLVTRLNLNVQGEVISCELEAVINKQSYTLVWQELKNAERWLQGWR